MIDLDFSNILIISLSMILTVSLVSYIIVLKLKAKKLLGNIVQLTLDKFLMDKELDNISTNSTSDGFIKFLSESREAAFDYIVNVQDTVEKYQVAIQSNDYEKIMSVRNELFSYLPEKNSDAV